MPLLEGLVGKLAVSLTAGVIKAAGVRFGKKLSKTETEKALERCGAAAVRALVEAGLGTESEAPSEHLEHALSTFVKNEVVHDVLARAMREGSLPPEEIAELREAFEAEHPRKVLPDFDVERGVAAFVVAFVDQADEEEAFQGVIQTKELRAQTRTLREQLNESRRQTRLLEEVVDRLPDAQREAKGARTRYLKALRKECLILPLARRLGTEGLDFATSLDQVYIQLDTKTPKERPEKRTEPARGPGMEREERLSALEAFTASHRLVLLGGAGSGKSTFAKVILAQLAASALRQGTVPPAGLFRDLLPVFLTLQRLSGRLQDLCLDGLAGRRRARALEEAVRDQILADLEAEYRVPEFAGGLRGALDDGRFVLALDGLDEVPEDLRGQVREAVLAAIEHYRPKKVLVTCRVLSYGGGFTLPGFESHELAPLDEEKIRAFCHAWYRAQGDLGRVKARNVEEGAGHLAHEVLKRPLDKLAGSPLLLTTMAIIHTRKTELPGGRAQVYENAIQLLARDWQEEKNGEKRVVQSSRLQKFLSDDSRLWPVLERIAFEAHRLGGRRADLVAGLPRKDLWELLSAPEYLGSVSLAEEFLRYADQRAGLLVGLGGQPGQPVAFGFVHRTFQEYLGGRYLVRGRGAARNLRARAKEGDLWSLAVDFGAETLLHVDRNREALLDLGFELAMTAPQDTAHWRRQVLWGSKMAALVGVDIVERDEGGVVDGAAFLEIIRPQLVDLLEAELPLVERAEAGRALARLEDPRQEVLRVDSVELCRIPAGRFLMGSPEREAGTWNDEHPQHQVEIAYEYWLSRYPVTKAQYSEFVEAGGYGEARFWAEAIAHGVWQGARVQAWGAEVPSTGPESYGEPWDLANHPVVGVSWYEALAFCRWLTERWREEDWLPEGWKVGLPSEAEWEKAARGGLEAPAAVDRRLVSGSWIGGEDQPAELRRNPDPARRYPWQGGFLSDRANTSESGVGTTNAVGCFPGGSSLYGCDEMAGNVLEWTRSLRGEYPYPCDSREQALREDLASEAMRVLRGGSFVYAAPFARCAVRNWVLPVTRLCSLGFRVSVSPFSSDL